METKAPSKVIESLNKIQRELTKQGIGKDSLNLHQKYNYRSIDTFYNVLSPLLGENQILVLPSCESHDIKEGESRSGTATYHVIVKVQYRFVSTIDSSSVSVTVYGEAMDTGGDKATNKAMSAAYKLAMVQTFCIPTEGDNDADAHSPEVKAKARNPITPPSKEKLGTGNRRLPAIQNDPEYEMYWNHVIEGAMDVSPEELRGMGKPLKELGMAWVRKAATGDNMALLSDKDIAAVNYALKNPIKKTDPYSNVETMKEHLDK